jgi:hypothetical protein
MFEETSLSRPHRVTRRARRLYGRAKAQGAVQANGGLGCRACSRPDARALSSEYRGRIDKVRSRERRDVGTLRSRGGAARSRHRSAELVANVIGSSRRELIGIEVACEGDMGKKWSGAIVAKTAARTKVL